MNRELELDRLARERICEEIDRNFFVEAGAGSGKTFSLVQRMAAMAEQGRDISRICAITFTKAAANEFYERFHKELAERSAKETDPQKKANLTNALQKIDLCFLGTIDAFCGMILSEHPAEAKIPSGAAVMSKQEETAAYTAAFSEIARGGYGQELQEKYRIFCRNHYDAKTVFVKSLTTIAGLRNAEYIFREEDPLSELTEAEREEEKAELLQMFRDIGAHKDTVLYRPKSARSDPEKYFLQFAKFQQSEEKLRRLDWEKDPKTAADILRDANGLYLVKDCSVAARYGDLFEPGKRDPYTKLVIENSRLYRFLKRQSYVQTMDFLTSAVAAVTERLRAQGRLTYFDNLLYLRDMLREDIRTGGGKLTRHIAARHSYFLIDEFQDTNPMQAEIFFYLAAQEPAEDWRACKPRPGALFIVGDPKQSIYRFRSADVGAFLDVKRLFADGEVLILRRNFRSTKKICDWFNRAFTGIFPETPTPMQSDFPTIPTQENTTPEGSFGGILTYTVQKGKKNEFTDLSDTEQVVRIISRLVNKDRYLIQSKDDKALRKIRFNDFMVILPTKTKMKDFINAFADNNIPAKVEGDVTFSRCPALKTLSVIYSATANPEDEAKVYAALQNALRVPEQALSAYLLSGGSLSLRRNIPDSTEHETVTASLRQLKEFAEQAGVLPPVTVLGNIRQHRRLFETAGADSLEYYYYAIELLRAAESDGTIISAADAAAFLQELLSDKSGMERSLSLKPDAQQDRVHIANLHKVKGLEAPIVILAGPSRNNVTPDICVMDTPQGKKCWVFSLQNDGFPMFSTKGFEDIKNAEQQQLDEEKIRLLYVAATRARNALIIADARNAGGGRAADNPWTPFLDLADGDFFETYTDDSVIYTEAQKTVTELYDEEHQIAHLDSVRTATYTLQKPSEQKSCPAVARDGAAEADEPMPTRSEDGLSAAKRGTVVHRLMELLVTSRNRTDIIRATAQILNEQEITDARAAKTLLSVAYRMQNGGYEQPDGSPADLLDELLSADEVLCEVPFCSQTAGETVPVLSNGVMDVIYRKDGQWHIVDYKTNEDASDLAAKYQGQLAAYTDAFFTLTGERADARLYHIDC